MNRARSAVKSARRDLDSMKFCWDLDCHRIAEDRSDSDSDVGMSAGCKYLLKVHMILQDRAEWRGLLHQTRGRPRLERAWPASGKEREESPGLLSDDPVHH